MVLCGVGGVGLCVWCCIECVQGVIVLDTVDDYDNA